MSEKTEYTTGSVHDSEKYVTKTECRPPFRNQDGVQVLTWPELQALVYDILPPTTAIIDYAICLRNLSANEQFFRWCSTGGKYVTDNSNYIPGVSFI